MSPSEWQPQMNPKDFGHGAWWINASGGRVGTTTVKVGDTFPVVNEGGESHAFTQVEAYIGSGRSPRRREP